MADYPAVQTASKRIQKIDDYLANLTSLTVDQVLVYYGVQSPLKITNSSVMSDIVDVCRDAMNTERAILVQEIKDDADCV